MVKIGELLKTLIKKGAFSILLGTLCSKFVAFFASVFVVRLLPKEQYGLLSYFENIYGYFYIFAGLGLANAILRYVVIKESVLEKKNVFDYAIKLGSFVNILLLVIATIFIFFFPRPAEFSTKTILFEVVILLLPIRYIIDCCLNLERASFKNNSYAIYSFLLSFIVVFFRVLGSKFNEIEGAVIYPFIAQVIFCIIIYFTVIKQNFSVHKCEGKRKKLNLEKREINVYSIQYMITNGLWAVFMLNDVFIIGNLLKDVNLVADYKVAYVLPACLSMISSSIGIFVAPYFTKYEKEGKYEWVWSNWKKTFLLSVLLIGMISLVLVLFSDFFICLLYGETYLSITSVMKILTISSFINAAIRYPTANILASVGLVKVNLISAIIGVVLQIILDLLIIKQFSIIGIAFVNVFVYIVMSIIVIVCFVKKFKLKK